MMEQEETEVAEERSDIRWLLFWFSERLDRGLLPPFALFAPVQ